MPASDLRFHASQLSSQPKCSKLMVIYILVLLLSLGFTSGQRRSFNHQIDNRNKMVTMSNILKVVCTLSNHDWLPSPGTKYLWHQLQRTGLSKIRPAKGIDKKIEGPEIDPFWYVGRGVRPIGRFGKRQLKFGRSSLRSASTLDLILNALREQEALEEALEEDGEVW